MSKKYMNILKGIGSILELAPIQDRKQDDLQVKLANHVNNCWQHAGEALNSGVHLYDERSRKRARPVR